MKESMPMDRRIFLLFLSFYCSAFLLAPHAAAVSTPDSIIISEIQIAGKDTDDDFVELYNTTDHSINITGWELRRKTQGDKTTRGTLFHKFEPFQCDTQNPFLKTDTLSPHGFLLWTNKGGKAPFIDHFDVQSDNKMSPALTNDNSLALFDNKEVLINAVTWGSEHSKPFAPSIIYSTNPPKNTSIERTPFDVFFLSQLQPTPTQSTPLSCPTPTLPNPPPDLPPPQDPKTVPITIRVNEIFPNPEAKGDSGEFIELYNFGSAAADISGWTLRDATKTGAYVFPSGTSLSASGYFVVTDQSFKISLNNTDETVSLFDKTGTLIDTVSYAKTKEDVSLNYTESGWRGGTPTPGSANILNNLPEIREKVPKKGFKNTLIDFTARGKDSDGDTIKYVWDFGDGHKSYKNKTTHRYEKNGTYTVRLTTNDGKDDVTETFTLKMSSYDPPKVRITALVPNPAGNDTDNE